MKKSLATTLMLIAMPLGAHAVEHTEILTIETEVDKSKMYNFDLVAFRLIPESVTLLYDPNKNTFADQQFDLEIETSIPVDDIEASSSSGYQLTLEENISACYTEVLSADPTKLVSGYDNITTLYLDGQSGEAVDATGIFLLGSPKVITDFNDKIGASKNSHHNVTLTFSPISNSEGDSDIRFCQGAFTISFRLNI